ncbi:hypothetical protein [uncultured Kordia sp.]|uniref:hypothetical protein n=1 Tax=uncultured Kordia sp. TaxID=507699 RepID=UPI0026032EC8|nr:hypothetical protein [uncultured Kordia sp.]
MKKRNLKSLKLNKKSISDLNKDDNLVGGAFTSGCSDGCGPLKTAWNCTRADCTSDCGTLFCDTDFMCTF